MKFLQKFFSIKNNNNHKILTFLGLKIKIKQKATFDFENMSKMLEKILFTQKCLQQYLLIKETFPEIIESYKCHTSQNITTLSKDIVPFYNERPEIKEIRTWFTESYENLVSSISLITSTTSIEEKIKLLLNAISKNTYNQPNCIYVLLRMCMYYGIDAYKNYIDEVGNIIIHNFANQNQHSILLYIVYNYYKNQAQAKKLLKKYIQNYGIQYIDNYVETLALYENIENLKTNYGTYLLSQFNNSENLQIFKDLVFNKRIAIVGNGPQQKNKKTGNLINSYDLVVRFNSFNIDGEYSDDYGSKYDIVTLYDESTKSKYPLKNKTVIFMNDFRTTTTTTIKYLYKLLENGNTVIRFPLELRNELYKKYNIQVATSGLCMLYWIKKYNSNFSANDCFGFSFKSTQDIDTFSDYFSEECYSRCFDPHDLNIEKKTINKIFKNEDL